MSYITINFREFVKQQLIQETKKNKSPLMPVDKPINRPSNDDYIERLRQEWDEAVKGK